MFLTDLAEVLRADGLSVVEVDGWRSRTYDGNGLAGNAGVMHHHTATAESAFAYSDCPTLNLLINGRSDLPGPLCNLAFGRSGTVYVVAAGQANHAGRGSFWGSYTNLGNYYTIGIEAESSGTRDDWTEDQRRVWPYLAAALDKAYSGGRAYYQVGHKEYSFDGKIDPAFIDMDDFRAQVDEVLTGVAEITGSVTAVAQEEEEMTDFLTKPIKNYKTGGQTTAETELGYLPENFRSTQESISNVRKEVLNQKILKHGSTQKPGEMTTLGLEMAYNADNFARVLNSLADLHAKVDALTALIEKA